ncbi:hypothetical protein SADUNF_Sadunf03G0167100 [Salix dunnii]|uniref:Uncharacterized protein n=1 Tax=Salix dunnii TaxID=1413687 RepID=A0A835TEL8_9ROSI|nr:hypothetical protein SADUNF_Sadunf03G0167100 [Salix dunnii]
MTTSAFNDNRLTHHQREPGAEMYDISVIFEIMPSCMKNPMLDFYTEGSCFLGFKGEQARRTISRNG